MLHKSYRSVFIWLLLVNSLIAGIVIVGGATRLTRSGLSIVEWKPVTGVLPPLNASQWQEEFQKYKKFPEYKKHNSHLNLEQFKSIFYWEFLHRLLGRLIGLVFIIPLVYFYLKKKLTTKQLLTLSTVFILGALQGGLGWYMVKSGLIDKPQVSHFRLASHLLTAFLVFQIILWFKASLFTTLRSEFSKKIVFIISAFVLLVTLQIVYGAFVAGLKAGYLYNTFPLMGDSFLPSFSESFSLSTLVNNKAVVQFIHRILAMLVFIFAFSLYYILRKNLDDKYIRVSYIHLITMITLQVLVGIVTLLSGVIIYVAVLHQLLALFSLSVAVLLLHSIIYSYGKTIK